MTVAIDLVLVANIHSYIAKGGAGHVDRWTGVLAAFGDVTYDNPMTATEAQTYVDRGWDRWIPVVATLKLIEAVNQQDQTPPPPPPPHELKLVTNIHSYTAETHNGQEHVDRWHRVLEAFGVESFDNLEPMTATEAQTYADHSWDRWIPVVTELQRLEASG